MLTIGIAKNHLCNQQIKFTVVKNINLSFLCKTDESQCLKSHMIIQNYFHSQFQRIKKTTTLLINMKSKMINHKIGQRYILATNAGVDEEGTSNTKRLNKEK